jgi:PPOX class probable FMN-dependent enzyme
VSQQFTEIIDNEEALRAIIGHPTALTVNKTIPRIDEHCADFIARSPFMLIASSDAQGRMDVSPKGDPPGFVRVLDEATLAIPDRPGNRRADTFTNILQNPRVGLFFLIPGKRETLRVSGTAQIVRDSWLRESMSLKGKVPDFALVVHVEEAFLHCAKCIIRSVLWDTSHWPTADDMASLALSLRDHGKLDLEVAEIENLIDISYRDRLY